MSCRFVSVCVLALVVGCQPVIAQEFPSQHWVTPTVAEIEEYGEEYLAVLIPTPIREYEIEKWCEYMTLSEAQTAACRTFYELYRGKDEQVRKSAMPEIWSISSAYAILPPHTYSDPTVVEGIADYMKQCRDISDAVTALEKDVLFEPMRPLLIDEQLVWLVVRPQETSTNSATVLLVGADLL